MVCLFSSIITIDCHDQASQVVLTMWLVDFLHLRNLAVFFFCSSFFNFCVCAHLFSQGGSWREQLPNLEPIIMGFTCHNAEKTNVWYAKSYI